MKIRWFKRYVGKDESEYLFETVLQQSIDGEWEDVPTEYEEGAHPDEGCPDCEFYQGS